MNVQDFRGEVSLVQHAPASNRSLLLSHRLFVRNVRAASLRSGGSYNLKQCVSRSAVVLYVRRLGMQRSVS